MQTTSNNSPRVDLPELSNVTLDLLHTQKDRTRSNFTPNTFGRTSRSGTAAFNTSKRGFSNARQSATPSVIQAKNFYPQLFTQVKPNQVFKDPNPFIKAPKTPSLNKKPYQPFLLPQQRLDLKTRQSSIKVSPRLRSPR